VLYAVCTTCSFLRAYSSAADTQVAPEACPACGSELVVRGHVGRFPPTYVSRVSRELLATPELRPDDKQRQPL
jgi:hypothetical protein